MMPATLVSQSERAAAVVQAGAGKISLPSHALPDIEQFKGVPSVEQLISLKRRTRWPRR